MDEYLFRRLARYVVAVCGGLIACEVAWRLRLSLDVAWNDASLAPTVAMLRGLPLWPAPADDAPQLDMIYGPGAALVWIPAAIQATPVRAIAVGLLQSLLLTLLSVAWIVRTEARHHPTVLASAVLLGLAFMLSTPVLPGFSIRADVPAQGFGTLALACAWTESRRRHAGWRWAGAAAVVAAVASKQVMVPLLVAYPAAIALASGLRRGLQALVALAAVATSALLLLVFTTEVDSMVAATIVGPSRQPWRLSSPTEALSSALADLLRRGAPAVALLALAAVLLRRKGPAARRLLQSNRWLLPLIVAVACVPTALLGRVKVGGSTNTLAPSIGFLWVAMVTAYASAARRGRFVRQAVTAVALLVSSALALRVAPELRGLPSILRERPLPIVAFEAARLTPGTLYFPARPTNSLMAEDRATHSTAALEYRHLEGRGLDARHVRAFLPPALERVAAEGTTFPFVLSYLPEFRRQVADPSLPAWTVLVVDDLLAPGAAPGPLMRERRDPQDMDTRVLASLEAPVRLQSARLWIVRVGRRDRARLDGTIDSAVPHLGVDIDVLLRDRLGRHLLTLAATSIPDSAGRLSAEWPLFNEVRWSADRALVIARGGSPLGGEVWRMSAARVRTLAEDAP